MNKEAFLEKLKEYLGILEDGEQQDILEEYAQHIDMKMQKGLSEEEAIQDFGPMEELAEQILEAYHVKPQFSGERNSIGFTKTETAGTDEEADRPLPKAFAWLKEKAAEISRGIKNVFSKIGKKCRAFGRWCSKPFGKDKAVNDITEEWAKEQKTKEMGKGIKGILKTIENGIVTLCRACCLFCVWCLKWIWNLGWLMFSILCALMAMIVLMGLGAVLVFLFQGYPFYGIFVLCLGGMLCFGALAGGAF
ncbi:MAG: DUF1700 domain-containing protein, partial [Lachnoclostridium sp.]|nr:DUF1700 domain-containing protein [Lachnoclostridium sp.]